MKLQYSGGPIRFPDLHLELKGGEIIDVGDGDAKLLLVRPDFKEIEVGGKEEHEEVNSPKKVKVKQR